ncbi:protein HEXIM1-like [Mustelus asterias]
MSEPQISAAERSPDGLQPPPSAPPQQRQADDAVAAAAPPVVGGCVAATTAVGGGDKKRRHRRRPSKKKRRWRPYFKLSWEEKKALDERESVRAAKTRAEMFAKGFTVAPYNTTQFLMEEHNQEEPDLNTGPGAAAAAGGGGGAAAPGGGGGGRLCPPRRAARPADPSDDDDEEELLLLDEEEQQDSGSDGMGGHGGGEFLQRDFSETYERYHAESLHNMSKQELIREYLELEKCLSRLEDENNRLRGRLPLPKSGEVAEDKLKELEREMERLRAQNLQLLRENELYKTGPRLSDSAD